MGGAAQGGTGRRRHNRVGLSTGARHPHRTVPVKVNAWVDAGVASLVEALNALPDVVTLDSCEGDGRRAAYVLLTATGDLDGLAAALADALGRTATVAVHGEAGCDRLVELRLAPGAVPAASAALGRLAAVGPARAAG